MLAEERKLLLTENMRNRFIYILIGLMLVSLIGIIWIQSSWINGAIAEGEHQFEVHVNDALNAVNEAIDVDETEFILEKRFGDLDSLVNGVIVMNSGNADITLNLEGGELKNKIAVSTGKKMDQRIEHRIEIHSTDSNSEGETEDIAIWEQRVEAELDTAVMLQEIARHRIQNMESLVDHYTVELLLSGDLKNRIQAADLKGKLIGALRQEGIDTTFAYAVKNMQTGQLEAGFVSDGFVGDSSVAEFRKQLFPNDRISNTNYELILQPKNSRDYVWSKVWKMTLLSVVFTVLILFSFGYALYFIFRQKRLSQVKNDFINNMTHELKTPLASIALATASINHPEVIRNPEEIRRLTGAIDAEKERMHQHVERVLETAALEVGEINLHMTENVVNDLVLRAFKNVEMALANAGGTLEIRVKDGLMISGDAFHLINALTNILDNSIKYRSEKPLKLKVSAEAQNKKCILRIQDNGIGMSPREQRHAFDTFYRAESGDVHNQKGFGLGLSYVKGVIEKHKGQVLLDSKRGQGTTVEIHLSLTKE